MKIVENIVRVWFAGGSCQCGLSLVLFLVFADVDSERDDDHEREDNDDAEDDDHHPVVTRVNTVQSCDNHQSETCLYKN